MIITRAPLRISLAGGGTDLPSYYKQTGRYGHVLSAAIDKYVYVAIHRTFEQEIIVKYSQMERVRRVEAIQHPIIRETLKWISLTDLPHLEITSFADIPAGTGLGSSSSFTVALIKALHVYQMQSMVLPEVLAEEACHIEIDCLGEPIGRQDQFIAAYGGLKDLRFNDFYNAQVDVQELLLTRETLEDLSANLLLFFTGISRSASHILNVQNSLTHLEDEKMLKNLDSVREMADASAIALKLGQIETFVRLMDEHWQLKQRRGASTPQIDKWYALGKQNGALGGKLVGAGGGGFLLFYAADRELLRKTMEAAGLKEVRFHFDFEGAKVLIHD